MDQRADAGPDRAALGRAAEEIAARHLAASGLRVLERNARAGRDEIDLIAREGDAIVFVEVRCRQRGAAQDALASVGIRKRRRLLRAARRLIAEREWGSHPCRFDIVAILHGPDGFRLRHIRNAIVDDDP